MLKWEKGLALKECEGSVQVSRQTTHLDLACTLLSHHSGQQAPMEGMLGRWHPGCALAAASGFCVELSGCWS